MRDTTRKLIIELSAASADGFARFSRSHGLHLALVLHNRRQRRCGHRDRAQPRTRSKYKILDGGSGAIA